MAVISSWIHGNVLAIESPERIFDGEQVGRITLTPLGWGASVSAERGGEASWLHLAIPTVHIPTVWYRYLELLRVYLLFETSAAEITAVHVYDGHNKIKSFDNLSLRGTYLDKRQRNEFVIQGDTRHRVRSGIGVSFFFQADTLIDQGPNPRGHLLVAAAGAEFQVRSMLLSTTLDFVRKRTLGWFR